MFIQCTRSFVVSVGKSCRPEGAEPHDCSGVNAVKDEDIDLGSIPELDETFERRIFARGAITPG